MFEKKKPVEEIVEITGFCERTIRQTISNYKRGGMSALKPKIRGRKAGEKRTLTADQEKKLVGIITDKNPDQLKMKAKKMHINMISAISNQGKLHFMFRQDSINQQKLIEFLERLIKDVQRKVYMILDNLKVHHGKLVADWAELHKDQIRLYFLLSYSPGRTTRNTSNHISTTPHWPRIGSWTGKPMSAAIFSCRINNCRSNNSTTGSSPWMVYSTITTSFYNATLTKHATSCIIIG